jgi:hypothetical protein
MAGQEMPKPGRNFQALTLIYFSKVSVLKKHEITFATSMRYTSSTDVYMAWQSNQVFESKKDEDYFILF